MNNKKLPELPEDCFKEIFSFLPMNDLFKSIALVNKEMNGSVEFFSMEPFWGPRTLKLNAKKIDGKTVFPSIAPDNVRVEIVNSINLTDEKLKSIIEGLGKNIFSLDLSSCRKITNKGLKHISKITNLKHLNISRGTLPINNNITNENERLMEEYFANCQDRIYPVFISYSEETITIDGLNCMADGLPNLESLNLSGCDQITNEGLKKLLAKLKKLVVLNVSQCYLISNSCLKTLVLLTPNLEIIKN